MKQVNLEPVTHRNERRLLIKFSYDQELIGILKKIKGSTWSQTHRSWHVPNNPEKLKELFREFKGFAFLDTTAVFDKAPAFTDKEIILPLKISNPENTCELTTNNDPQETELPWQNSFSQDHRSFIPTPKPNERAEIHMFRDWMHQKRYCRSTIESYCEVLSIFFNYYKAKSTDAISNDDIIKFNINYILQKKLSFSYQNQFVNAIKLFYKTTFSRNIEIDSIERPRRAKRLPKVISKNDIMLMLKSIKNQKHRMALTIIYAIGLRRSELINMKVSHINYDRKNVTIFNGKGQKDRVLPLSDKLIELIKKYIMVYKPEVYLIEGQGKSQPYSGSSLEKIFHNYFDSLIKNHNFTLHCLRHSYATHIMENGTDLRSIQTLLGHKSSKTTEIYTWVSMKNLQNIKNPIDDFDL